MRYSVTLQFLCDKFQNRRFVKFSFEKVFKTWANYGCGDKLEWVFMYMCVWILRLQTTKAV